MPVFVSIYISVFCSVSVYICVCLFVLCVYASFYVCPCVSSSKFLFFLEIYQMFEKVLIVTMLKLISLLNDFNEISSC